MFVGRVFFTLIFATSLLPVEITLILNIKSSSGSALKELYQVVSPLEIFLAETLTSKEGLGGEPEVVNVLSDP